jgi:crystallin alpha B
VKVDVHQFSPDELTVKAVENFLVVEGIHGEKEDDHGMISRSFKRRYRLPDDINPDEFDERVSCELSTDGILTIVIPRKKLEITDAEGKVEII